MKFLMDHIVLNVTDVEREVEFYVDILGFAPERIDLYRQGKAPFPSVRINNDTIIDFFPGKMRAGTSTAERTGTNLNHFCLAVCKTDFDILSERLPMMGVEIEQGPVKRWGAHGTGVSIYFRDPEKNLIEVRHYENGNEPEPCLLGS